MSALDSASKLKDEGNAFFTQKNYQKAYEKYSEAIASMGPGGDKEFKAIVFGNRAACCFGLEKYLDAAGDASKSVEINPAYTKGWGRLGSSRLELGSWEAAIAAFDHALSSLYKARSSNGDSEPQPLSPAEKKQEKKYQDGIKQAREKIEKGESAKRHVISDTEEHMYPWQRVNVLYDEMMQKDISERDMKSSVWVMWGAERDFQTALTIMKSQKHHTLPNGQTAIISTTGAVQEFSNAIMRDERVFRMTDVQQFLTMYTAQAMAEGERANATSWYEQGPEVILREAQHRVFTQGWDQTRFALATTVRRWIIRAFLHSGISQTFSGAVHYLHNALEVITRGREIWADEPDPVRGTIFSESFELGVRRMYCNAYFQAWKRANDVSEAAFVTPRSQPQIQPNANAIQAFDSSTSFPKPVLSLQTLYEIADTIIKDVPRVRARMTLDTSDPGFYSAFTRRPLAEALAIRAFCHRQLGMQYTDPEEAYTTLRNSYLDYLAAADVCPVDDESHAWHLLNACSVLCSMVAPLAMLLPQIADLRDAIPLHKPLWSYSQLARDGRDHVFSRFLGFEREAREMIGSGELTEQAVCSPGGEILARAFSAEMGPGQTLREWDIENVV